MVVLKMNNLTKFNSVYTHILKNIDVYKG